MLTLSFGTKIIFSSRGPVLKEAIAKILKLNRTHSIALRREFHYESSFCTFPVKGAGSTGSPC